MKVSKGLELPVALLPGVEHMPAPGKNNKKVARVFYLAATRAIQRVFEGIEGTSKLVQQLKTMEY